MEIAHRFVFSSSSLLLCKEDIGEGRGVAFIFFMEDVFFDISCE